MENISRRTVLGAAAAIAGGLALPGSIAKAYAIEPNVRTGTIQDVEHVVILMQENRSFDHYFGTMNGVRGFGDPRPWKLPNGQDVWHQPTAKVKGTHYHPRGLAADATYVLPFDIDSVRTSENIDGTNHGWSSGHLAWNQGRYDEWVNQKQDPLTMAYLTEKENSYHRALANAFTICDAYFCSVHADTAPNRVYLWTGTIDAQNTMGRKPNGPGLWERNVNNGYTWTTYPERLEAKGVSWKVYQGGTGIPGDATDNYTDNSLEFFSNFQKAEGGSPTLIAKGASNHTLAELKADVQSGNLPAVSWVVTPYKYSEHPSASPTDGAIYIDTVLEALTSDPDVWAKTVFILNYDENDGFFDHVVPPMPPLKNTQGGDGMVSASLASSLPQEILDLDLHPGEAGPLIPGADPLGKQPIGLGPRVPLMLISPWTKGGWVCSEVFDHTSVLRFLEKRFGIEEPNISAWRRSTCGDLTSAFDFARPSVTPESFTRPPHIKGLGQPFSVPAQQQMPKQDQGQRPARPLGYRFGASVASVTADSVSLTLSNEGSIGCYFYIRDNKAPNAAPRRYQIAAGESVTDVWASSGGYSLSVWGANGYLAEFAGDGALAAQQAVTPTLNPTGEELKATLTNNGSSSVSYTVSNSYDDKAAKTVTVKAGHGKDIQVNLQASHGWYDLTVQGQDGLQFTRRYAGHAESKKPSFTDPKMGQA